MHVSLRGAATHTVFVGRKPPSTWLEPFGGLINNIALLMQLLPRRNVGICLKDRNDLLTLLIEQEANNKGP